MSITALLCHWNKTKMKYEIFLRLKSNTWRKALFTERALGTVGTYLATHRVCAPAKCTGTDFPGHRHLLGLFLHHIILSKNDLQRENVNQQHI